MACPRPGRLFSALIFNFNAGEDKPSPLHCFNEELFELLDALFYGNRIAVLINQFHVFADRIG